nr:proline-rich receptor-like protein kinase PERK2 [Aegilops tauschii subsp. strangulata]
MPSPLPNPSLPLPVTSSPPATTTTIAQLLPTPPAVLTPEEVSGALRALIQAVQDIHLFLAASYGPHPVAPPVATTAPPWLPPHQAAYAALAGRYRSRCSYHPPPPPPRPGCSGSRRSWRPPPQQPLLLPQGVPATLAGPLQLPSTATTAPPWLQWQLPLLAASAAPGSPLQQPPPVSSGPASTAPVGVSIHQIKFPSSPSPLPQGVPIQQITFPLSPSLLPAWITTRHVSAAVRLQAAVRGLLVRQRVREMCGL